MLHKPSAIGALWNVIPTTPHISLIAQGNPLKGLMISTFVFGVKLYKHVIIRNYYNFVLFKSMAKEPMYMLSFKTQTPLFIKSKSYLCF